MVELPGLIEITPSRATISIGWDDVPHLTKEAKEELLRGTMPHLREARSKGIPSLGEGAIYPISEEDIKIAPFTLPAHWPRSYALDVGWNRTAALWQAWDRDTDTVYLYSEHYRGQAEPVVHAAAIKARGGWIPGVIDPASRGKTQDEGKKILDLYRKEGLTLTPADNAREAGLLDVWQRLSTGRIKVFASLGNWFSEFRIYRRDKNGKVVKENDHLMDDTRYLIRTGLSVARVPAMVLPPVAPYTPGDSIAGY